MSFANVIPYNHVKNAQVVTNLQTECNKSVHKLLKSCVRTVCSKVVGTIKLGSVNNLVTSLIGPTDLLPGCSPN